MAVADIFSVSSQPQSGAFSLIASVRIMFHEIRIQGGPIKTGTLPVSLQKIHATSGPIKHGIWRRPTSAVLHYIEHVVIVFL